MKKDGDHDDQAPEAKRQPFRVQPFDSKFMPGVDLLHLNQLTDELEVQHWVSRNPMLLMKKR